jgi:hypothetical protein
MMRRSIAGFIAMIRIGNEFRQCRLAPACFYVSNVEFYLFGSERWNASTINLCRLPDLVTRGLMIR